MCAAGTVVVDLSTTDIRRDLPPEQRFVIVAMSPAPD